MCWHAAAPRAGPGFPPDPPPAEGVLIHPTAGRCQNELKIQGERGLTPFKRGAVTDQGFPKGCRLLSETEFTPVFSQPDFRVSSRFLLLLARASDLPQGRLGIVVGKKNVARSVQRNRIKRIIRESFRRRKSDFGTIDLVVLARKGLHSFDNCDIQAQLHSLFDELSRKRLQKQA